MVQEGMGMNRIVVSVSCYNNDDEIVTFAKDLAKQVNSEQLYFLVTCNSCLDFNLLHNRVVSAFENTKVFLPGSNLGYLHGCLYGIKNAEIDYDWALICNTDIQFRNDDFFNLLTTNVTENVWCIGPDITLLATGEHQNPYLVTRPSKKHITKWKVMFNNRLAYMLTCRLAKIKHKYFPKKQFLTNKEYVYALHGSCFFLRKECVEAIERLHDPIFMYDEELLVAEVVRSYNKLCKYAKDAGIYHNENQVTGKIDYTKKFEWLKKSKSYIWNTFYRDIE